MKGSEYTVDDADLDDATDTAAFNGGTTVAEDATFTALGTGVIVGTGGEQVFKTVGQLRYSLVRYVHG